MKSIAILLLFSMLLLGACSKEDPAPSPMHQQVTGTSAIVKIDADDWEPSGTPGDEIYGYAASAGTAIITNEIVTHGTVRVQKQRPNGGWTELPATMEQDGVQLNWDFSYVTGRVTVRIGRNGAKVTPPADVTVYKVIAVPQL